MADTNLKSLTEAAIERLPWARRKIAQRVMSRHSDAVLEHVAAKLADNDEASEMHMMLNSEAFDGKTMMAIDPDKLEKWIMLILKILPLIIALF